MSVQDDTRAGAEARLDAALAALPRETTPQSDLWPAIESRISDPSSARAVTATARWLPLALAAGFAACFFAALAGAWLGARLGDTWDAPVAVTSANAEGIELAFAKARDDYMLELVATSPRLDDGTRTTVLRNLALIGKAVRELESALAADPGNQAYLDTLLMTRELEMGMLEDVTTTPITTL